MLEPLLRRLRPFAQVFADHEKSVFLVGGALRNLHLGREATDLDFATDAAPHEVQRYFRRVIPTGLQHGTVTVLFDGQSFEVTTFRVDSAYTDQRRPDQVAFSTDLAEDLRRRDFTINALALNLATGELVDLHGGLADLAAGVLRCIGDPRERFGEDALRIWRLFRFAAQLGFAVEPDTLTAALELKASVARISRERVRDELLKTLGAPRVDLSWPVLEREGLLAAAFEGLTPLPLAPGVYTAWRELGALGRLAVWLQVSCGAQRPAWESALRALKLSNHEVAEVLRPLQGLHELPEDEELRAKQVMAAWGRREAVEPCLSVLRSLVAAGGERWRGLPEAIDRAHRAGEPVYLSELAVNGQDLLEAGLGAGPQVGDALRRLQRRVWAQPRLNDKASLLSSLGSLG